MRRQIENSSALLNKRRKIWRKRKRQKWINLTLERYLDYYYTLPHDSDGYCVFPLNLHVSVCMSSISSLFHYPVITSVVVPWISHKLCMHISIGKILYAIVFWLIP